MASATARKPRGCERLSYHDPSCAEPGDVLRSTLGALPYRQPSRPLFARPSPRKVAVYHHFFPFASAASAAAE